LLLNQEPFDLRYDMLEKIPSLPCLIQSKKYGEIMSSGSVIG